MENFNCKVIDLSEMGYGNDYYSTSESDHHNRIYRTSCALHNVKKNETFCQRTSRSKEKIQWGVLIKFNRIGYSWMTKIKIFIIFETYALDIKRWK